MKRVCLPFVLILFFILMLLFPAPVFAGASRGLLLWFRSVLPTLLPFMILCSLMVRTNALAIIERMAGPLFSRLLGVSGNGAFAVIAGFLCGYPMGAKVTAELIRNHKISLSEGNYLLSFCNNTSPMFIISYVVWQQLHRQELTIPVLLILIFSPLFCSIGFHRYYKRRYDFKAEFVKKSSTVKPEKKPFFYILDGCMMDSVEAITKVGGYMMLFSIVPALIREWFPALSHFHTILLSSLEITGGVELLCTDSLSFDHQFVSVLALVSFGGWCAVAQTGSMIQGTGLSVRSYTIEKLITALVTSFIAFAYLKFVALPL